MKASDGFKICSHCRKDLPVSEYHKNKTTHDGFGNECKDCLSEIRKRNREKKHKYDELYYIENSDKKKQIANDWYYSNYGYARTKHMEYYRNHPEIRKAYYQTETYKQNHRKMTKIQNARRREMGFIKLMKNPFPDEVQVDWHHVNDLLVVPIPKKIHNKCSHLNPEEHRERCNIWLYYIYGMDIGKLLE
jgi:hypothetical protein